MCMSQCWAQASVRGHSDRTWAIIRTRAQCCLVTTSCKCVQVLTMSSFIEKFMANYKLNFALGNSEKIGGVRPGSSP